MKKRLALYLAIIISLLLIPIISFAISGKNNHYIDQADKEYKKQNYQEALDIYNELLNSKKASKKQIKEIELKKLFILNDLKKYDRLIKDLDKYLEQYPNSIWQARAYHLGSKVYLTIPHNGYKRDGKIYRDKNHREGQYVYTYNEDQNKAKEYFKKAKDLYQELRKEIKVGEEIIKLNFDLAKFLETNSLNFPILEYSKSISKKTNVKDKVIFLYDEILEINEKVKISKYSAKALYLKGIYLSRINGVTKDYDLEKNKTLKEENPMPVFWELINNYPKNKYASESFFAIAHTYYSKGKYETALEMYQSFIRRYPKARRYSDSQYYIQEIKKEQLNIQSLGVQKGNNVPKVSISYKNLNKVELSIHKIDLKRLLLKKVNDSNFYFTNFHSIFGNDIKKVKKYYQDKVYEKGLFLNNNNKYKISTKEYDLPKLNSGTYVLQVKGEHITTAKLLIISDITIVKNIDSNKAVVYVLDRKTGKPIKNAEVTVKERFYRNGHYKNKSKTGKSNKDGLFVYQKKSDLQNYSYLDVLAWKDNNLGITNQNYYYSYYSNNKNYKSYTYTDRPTYRPGNEVNFKEIIKLSDNLVYKNVENKSFQVKVQDPKGKTIYEKTLKTNEFGTINGKFKLKEDAPLGMYYINTYSKSGKYSIQQSSGRSFRVEEYKKPEFIVKVNNETNQIRPGEKAKLRINLNYYFGSPVKDAKLKYYVKQKPYYYYYYRSRNYDWLYGRHNHYYKGRSYNNNYNEKVLKQGNLTTDKDGIAYIEFDTEKSVQDFIYNIEVQATDKSRRVIKGFKSVKVTNKLLFASIDLDKGFYSSSENLKAEINLRNPDGEPVKGKGTLELFSLKYKGKNQSKEVKSLISSEVFSSDKNGRIFANFKLKKSGQYRLVFNTLDKYENKVKSERNVWVVDDQFSGQYYKFKNIELMTDERNYEEGDIARVMINSSIPNSYIMFFEEAGKNILDHKLFRMNHKSKLIHLKITKDHIPNFNLKAALINQGQLFLANQEVFVPPSKQFLKISLETNKNEYSPGEMVQTKIVTKDHKGKRVQSELSLGAIDSSVYYIQSDISGDIKLYYYGQRRQIKNYLTISSNKHHYSISNNTKKFKPYKAHNNPFYNYGYRSNKNMFDDNSLEEEADFAYKSDSPKPMATPVKKEIRSRGEAKQSSMAVNEKMGIKDIAKKAKAKRQNKNKIEEKVRTNFADTANWNPVIFTDKEGFAKYNFKLPDSLTDWQLKVVGIDKKNRVNQTTKNIKTKKELMVRLQAPRFFIERDQITLSAIVNNDSNQDKKVVTKISASNQIKFLDKAEKTIFVKAKSEKRVEWQVKVNQAGKLKLKVSAKTNDNFDAMEMKFPVYIHGIDKLVAKNGVIKNKKVANISLNIPKERKLGQTKLKINLSPSVANTMISALPYLATYPYGCVEQTTSKFIPTVLVSKTLQNLGIDLGSLANINVNSKIKFKKKSPVYDNNKINKMVKVGLKRLYKFQNADGGFGWWSGSRSDLYMSAYVINGLLLAKSADYQVNKSVVSRGVNYLLKEFKDEDNRYTKAYLAYVLSQVKKIKTNDLERLFKQRKKINNYGKALLSLAYSNLGDSQKAKLITQNLSSFAKVDKDNNTVYWENDYQWYWRWYGDRIETNAFILKAFMKANPDHELVPMLVKWLVNNRKGNRWYSTKDTANTIYALSDYVKHTKELSPNYTVLVLFNDKLLKKVKIDKTNMFTFENEIVLTDKELKGKTGNIKIIKEGKGTLYYSTFLEYFTLEENIKASGNEIAVDRKYYKLTEKKVNNKITYDKKLLKNGSTVKSGDLIEVKLTIKSNNDYEYLIFEDMKPSGFEADALKSGYVYQNGIYLNRELRDEKVIFFINRIKQGTQVLNYKLRAEIPGTFHALPHSSYAMYSPDIKAISDEIILKTVD